MLPPSPSSQTMVVGRGRPVALQLRLMKSPMAAVTLNGSSRNEGETVGVGEGRGGEEGVKWLHMINFYYPH